MKYTYEIYNAEKMMRYRYLVEDHPEFKYMSFSSFLSNGGHYLVKEYKSMGSVISIEYVGWWQWREHVKTWIQIAKQYERKHIPIIDLQYEDEIRKHEYAETDRILNKYLYNK